MLKLIRDIWSAMPFQAKTLLAAAVGVLIIVLIVVGRIGACRVRQEERKIEETKTKIQTSEIEANVLANREREVQENANNANADAQRTFDADSGSRDGDFSTVRRKWCTDHPDDSNCK